MCHICEDPPIATIYVNLFFSGLVSVVLTRKLIHLFDDLFRASRLSRRLPGGLVADESVVDAVVFLFTAFSCKLIRRKVTFTARCFSIPVTVWSVLSDVKFDMEKVSSTAEIYFRFSAESFVIRCPHVQYIIPALQCLRHTLRCHFGSALMVSQICVSCIHNCNF